METNRKRVKLLLCKSKLRLVKAIKENCRKSLLDAKNIVDCVVTLDRSSSELFAYKYGILLLNESSITPSQWEKISEQMGEDLQWEYV